MTHTNFEKLTIKTISLPIFPVSGDKEFFNVGVCLVLGPNSDAEVTADVDVTIQLDRRIEFVSYHSETGKTMVTQVKGIGNKVEKCVNVSMVTFSNNPYGNLSLYFHQPDLRSNFSKLSTREAMNSPCFSTSKWFSRGPSIQERTSVFWTQEDPGPPPSGSLSTSGVADETIVASQISV